MPSGFQMANSSATLKPRARSRAMSGEEEKDYEVGYKKPPAATRFRKGGRAIRAGDRTKLRLCSIAESSSSTSTLCNGQGSRRRMPKAEIQFRQMFAKA